jgi:hypothetical protein
MDWSSKDKLRLWPIELRLEAIRLAARERLQAGGVPSGSAVADLVYETFNPLRVPATGLPSLPSYVEAIDALIAGAAGGYVSPSQYEALPSASFDPSFLTFTSLLLEIGDAGLVTVNKLGGNLLDWIWQRYRMINKLRYLKPVSVIMAAQQKYWGDSPMDWTDISFGGIMTTKSEDESGRERFSATVNFDTRVSSRSRSLQFAAQATNSPGDDFDNCGNVDANGAAIVNGSWHVLSKTASSAANTLTTPKYNDIDIDPGRAGTSAGWGLNSYATIADFTFNFRDW